MAKFNVSFKVRIHRETVPSWILPHISQQLSADTNETILNYKCDAISTSDEHTVYAVTFVIVLNETLPPEWIVTSVSGELDYDVDENVYDTTYELV